MRHMSASVPARRPSRSPFFATAIGVAVLIVGAIALGVLVHPLAGGLLFGIGLILLILHIAIRPEGQLRDAAAETVPASQRDGRPCVLVVADAPLAGEEVAARIRETLGEDVQLDVIAPVLVSPLHYAMSDRDAEMEEARRRLDTSLAWAREHGFSAHGTIGSDEPETAMADALRRSGAEAIVVVTGDHQARRGWAERRELKRPDAELEIPVVHVEV